MEYGTGGSAGSRIGRRPTGETETKQAFKTTEFWVYVVILLGLFIAGLAADSGDDSVDGFGAERVWLYAVLLSIGYMISRGIAKSGSRDPYVDDPSSSGGDSLSDRAKAAAQVLKGEQPASGTTTQTQPLPPADEPRY